VQGIRKRPRWWLIAKNGNGRVGFPTTDRDGDGGETLPMFGHEEEAEMFLHSADTLTRMAREGEQSRQDHFGALRPCSCAEGVALDLLPGMFTDKMLGLVRLRRKRFLGRLLGHG